MEKIFYDDLGYYILHWFSLFSALTFGFRLLLQWKSMISNDIYNPIYSICSFLCAMAFSVRNFGKGCILAGTENLVWFLLTIPYEFAIMERTKRYVLIGIVILINVLVFIYSLLHPIGIELFAIAFVTGHTSELIDIYRNIDFKNSSKSHLKELQIFFHFLYRTGNILTGFQEHCLNDIIIGMCGMVYYYTHCIFSQYSRNIISKDHWAVSLAIKFKSQKKTS